MGSNPSPTLISNSKVLRKLQPNSSQFLLTDSPKNWKGFAGEVCDASEITSSLSINEFTRRNKEVVEIAGGYWLNTIKRLFVLSALEKHIFDNSAIMHLESDVLLNVSSETTAEILKKINKVAVPRFSNDLGIGSILIAPNLHTLRDALSQLEEILNSKKSITNDMELLGYGLNNSILQELPTLPSAAWEMKSGDKLIFDGAALGQYLFGQDPIHAGGFYISGYKNPNYPIDPGSFHWYISEEKNKIEQIKFQFNNSQFLPVNLHNHAKRILNEVNSEDNIWQELMAEANTLVPRKAIIAPEDSIHSRTISFPNRLRKALKMGILRYSMLAIKYRIRKLIKLFG